VPGTFRYFLALLVGELLVGLGLRDGVGNHGIEVLFLLLSRT
jgi:hypothetical protein